jgi:hypothetical protein
MTCVCVHSCVCVCVGVCVCVCVCVCTCMDECIIRVRVSQIITDYTYTHVHLPQGLKV